MKIVVDFPPNYKAIDDKFHIANRQVVFAYGDIIYNPKNLKLQDHIIAHEETHGRQHAAYPGGPAAWWERYLAESAFLLSQEVEAYANQLKFTRERYGREQARWLLKIIAGDLSSAIYGNIVTFDQARNLIKSKIV